MKKKILIAGIIILAITSSVAILLISQYIENEMDDSQGFLEGRVVIGPLCPVEPCDLSPEQIAKIYEERKIIVYTSEKLSIVTIISLDQTGEYRAALNPGKYIVDINRMGMDSSDDVPKEIAIEPGMVVRLDIQIDTGIR